MFDGDDFAPDEDLDTRSRIVLPPSPILRQRVVLAPQSCDPPILGILCVPATSPIVMTNRAARIWVLGEAQSGVSRQRSLVLLGFFAALSTRAPFIVLDMPPSPPIVVTNRAQRVGILGKHLASFSGQVPLVHFFVGNERSHAVTPLVVASRLVVAQLCMERRLDASPVRR